VPAFIDSLNEELGTGEITYDESGVKNLCSRVKVRFEGDESAQIVLDIYIPELEKWLCSNI
jgi:hypothetical protein